jgi:hypothetical protein
MIVVGILISCMFLTVLGKKKNMPHKFGKERLVPYNSCPKIGILIF